VETHLGSLLTWIAIGLSAVIISRYVLRIDQPLGMVVTIALGVVGAIVGGFVAQYVDMGTVRSLGNIDWVSIVITVVGAFALILIVGILRR
jgi:uncharacterized membrane protein YeaQ/YmgE (transglycosylase-associated protein family)